MKNEPAENFDNSAITDCSIKAILKLNMPKNFAFKNI